MTLKQLVRSIKNHIKMSAKGDAILELFDVEDNSVIFEVPTIDDIVEGTPASPDGEYVFPDGVKIVVSGGVVTSIEKPVVEEEVTETIEEQPVDVVEETETVEIEEIPETVENENKIKELEAQIAELNAQIEEMKKSISEKDAVITDVEKELQEIQNFYVDMNKSAVNERISINKNEEGIPFSFNKKK